MHVFKGHKNIVNCIDVTDADIYSGSWDMTIIQWSRAVSVFFFSFFFWRGLGIPLLVLTETLTLYIGWQTGEPVNVFQGHTDGVQCLQLYDDMLLSG